MPGPSLRPIPPQPLAQPGQPALSFQEPSLAAGLPCVRRQVMNGGEPSFDFSLSPQPGSLLIEYEARDNGVGAALDFLNFRINGDNANNYNDQYIRSYNGAPGGSQRLNIAQAGAGVLVQGGIAGNTFASGYVILKNYAADGRFKWLVGQVVAQDNVAMGVYSIGGVWKQATPARRITIFPNANQFGAGTTFSFYYLL